MGETDAHHGDATGEHHDGNHHASDSHEKHDYPVKDFRYRPAEQNVEDPMAKYRKWGYEQWPQEHEGMPYIGQNDVDSPMYRIRQWLVRGVLVLPKLAHDKLEDWRHSRPGWKRPAYYHRKYTRVTPIDQCEEGDMVCIHEAHLQFTRDREVEGQIVNLLRDRVEHCFTYEQQDWGRRCKKLIDDFMDAHTNYKIKYAEMGLFHNVITAYMKQKHRMIWERRHPDKIAGLYGFKYTEDRYYPADQIQYDAAYPMPK